MIQARIFLIGLGGTISLILENGRAKATDNLSNLIERADLNGLHTQWDTQDFFAKDGGDITLEDLFNLADFIASKSASFDGFIVTTGTDTLEEIAYGLDLLLDCTTNVVVSGAMRPPYASDFDSISNIQDAARVCLDHCGKRFGVDVVIGGKLIAARFAHKESISRLDSFVSTSQQAPAISVNRIDKEIVANIQKSERAPVSRLVFRDLNIPIISTSLVGAIDMEPYKEADGLVISCPGAASLSKEHAKALQDHLKSSSPIVLVSRSAQSDADVSAHYPGYFDELERKGFHVYDYVGLSPHKARLKLALSLFENG